MGHYEKYHPIQKGPIMHKTHQDRAVKISEKTLDMIADYNGGVKPQIEDATTYFVTCGQSTCTNLILPEKDFKIVFEFTEPEQDDRLCTVRDMLAM